MGTNTLTQIGIVAKTQGTGDLVDQYLTAISTDFVPRSSLGVPTTLAGGLGTTLLKWGHLYVDNILVDGNTISSLDTNGDINITPDGTGVINMGNMSVSTNTIASTDANGNINLTPNGTGFIYLDNSLSIRDVLGNAVVQTLNTDADLLIGPNGAGRLRSPNIYLHRLVDSTDTGYLQTFITGVSTSTLTHNVDFEFGSNSVSFGVKVTVYGDGNSGGTEFIYDETMFVGDLTTDTLTLNASTQIATVDPGARMALSIAAEGSNNRLRITWTYTGSAFTNACMKAEFFQVSTTIKII